MDVDGFSQGACSRFQQQRRCSGSRAAYLSTALAPVALDQTEHSNPVKLAPEGTRHAQRAASDRSAAGSRAKPERTLRDCLRSGESAAPALWGLAEQIDEDLGRYAGVFEVLAQRERDRADSLSAACLAAAASVPIASDLRWTPIDLVPSAEIADVGDSSFRRPTRPGRWPPVTANAPSCSGLMSSRLRKILLSGRRPNSWRVKRWPTAITCAVSAGWPGAPSGRSRPMRQPGAADEPHRQHCWRAFCCRDIIAWSHALTPAQRDQMLAMDPSRLPPLFLSPPDEQGLEPASGEIEQIKRRALRRAEQLSNIYLDDADSAADESSMELAQKLAAQSIMRLAGLRHIASELAA